MLYPGQIVYVKDEKHIGIFLGEDKFKSSYKPNLNVFELKGENGSDSDTFLYEAHELEHLTEKTKKTVTGQQIHYGPFKKKTMSGVISEKEFEENENSYLTYLQTMVKEPWINEQYALDTN